MLPRERWLVALFFCVCFSSNAFAREDGSSSAPVDESRWTNDSWSIYVSNFGTSVPGRASWGGGAGLSFTYALASWVRIDGGLAAEASSAGSEPHAMAAAMLLAGARFIPFTFGHGIDVYGSIKFIHMHEATVDDWGDHFFANLAGSSKHGMGHRSGASFGVGLDLPLTARFVHWRYGLEFSVHTMFEEPVGYYNLATFFGYAF